MAYVFQRNGKWFMGWTDAAGKQRKKKSPESTKQAAKARAHELERKAKLQAMGLEARTGESHAWDELVPAYIEEKVPNLRSNDVVVSVLNKHLVPAFKGRLLHEITVADAAAWVTKLRAKGLKDGTREQLRIRGSALFTFAQKKGWVAKGVNPFADPDVRVKKTKGKPIYLEPEEVRSLLRAADAEFRNICAVTGFCGLRKGEVAGLRWEDVDLPRHLITVRKSYDGPTKSGKERTVAIPFECVPFLVDQQRRTGKGVLVFPWPEDGSMRQRHWKAAAEFSALLKAAGVARTGLTFRTLRSTFGTHFAAQTGDLASTQDALGHADPSTTKDMYAAAIPEHRIQQGQRFSFGLTPRELPEPPRGEERLRLVTAQAVGT